MVRCCVYMCVGDGQGGAVVCWYAYSCFLYSAGAECAAFFGTSYAAPVVYSDGSVGAKVCYVFTSHVVRDKAHVSQSE